MAGIEQFPYPRPDDSEEAREANEFALLPYFYRPRADVALEELGESSTAP